jgi:Group II intron, maturase-specific domain
MHTAITQVYPEARVIADADECLVLHPDGAVLEPSQQLLRAWLAEGGLTLNVTTTRLGHPVEGEPPGGDFFGGNSRHYRVSTPPSGKGPRGPRRLGCKPLLNPAKANIKAPRAERGRLIRAGRAWPHAALIRQLKPKSRGWAKEYRPWVSPAPCNRVDHRTGVNLRP